MSATGDPLPPVTIASTGPPNIRRAGPYMQANFTACQGTVRRRSHVKPELDHVPTRRHVWMRRAASAMR